MSEPAATPQPAPAAAPHASGAPVLQAEGLKKHFGPKVVLRGVDLAVGDGEVVAIIGANGSGKSTFLRCLNLLETYQEGRVLLNGKVVSEGKADGHHFTPDEREQARMLRRHVGMVFQRFNLFPHLTVLKNVMCGPQYVLKMEDDEARVVAERALRKVGLWEKHPCDPGTLSGGQQQRAALARALAMHPDVLLSDEATSALDPVMTKEVFRVFRDLAKDGMTMLIVTHDMDFARDIAHRVVYMEEGVIAAEGTPKRIFDERPTPGLQKFLEKEWE
jgi:ABC-type polar amino acid transport system ATPase subunit